MRGNRFADNGSSRIAYEFRGRLHRRKPWLVLIQGLGFDRSGWAPVTSLLGRRFRLVLIDNRGSGRSTTPDRKFTVADMAADVAAVLDNSRIARAHVLGASLGGMVAQELAIRYPQRVDHLVLACTTPGWPYGYPMPRGSVQRMTAAASLPVEAAQRSLVENALAPDTLTEHPRLVERIVRNQKARPVDPASWNALASAGATYSGGTRQSLIRAPTLIMYGDADAVVDPRNSKLLAGRIPDSQVVAFAGLGHLFFWEEPAQFADAVTSFLKAPVLGARSHLAGDIFTPAEAAASDGTGRRGGGESWLRSRHPVRPSRFCPERIQTCRYRAIRKTSMRPYGGLRNSVIGLSS